MKPGSLLASIDRIPPCVCRLFARRQSADGWVPKSHREIAIEAGLSKSTVAELSRRKTWRGTPIGVADQFARACGVNLADPRDAIRRLRSHRTRLQHLKHGNQHQRRMISELLKVIKP